MATRRLDDDGQSGSRMRAPRRRKRSPSDRRREARRLAERIEGASRERLMARSEGRANDAHMADVELLGDDAGQAPRYAPTKRPDPYLVSHGGLFEEKRAGRGER
jgi:hypothetical protein